MANTKQKAVPKTPPARSEQTEKIGQRASASVCPPLQQEHQRSADRRCARCDIGFGLDAGKKISVSVGVNNKDAAAKIGAAIAERAKAAGVEECYFDRGGFIFHGKVKALADAAREGGLKF